MEDFLYLPLVISSFFLLLWCVFRVVHPLWWRPRYLDKYLRQQGIRGTPYKLWVGDIKEFVKSIQEAWSKPMTLTHQIAPRVDPFTYQVVQKYGKISLCWFGKTPKLIILDPELMREVLNNKFGHFQKPPLNPLILILAMGLTSLEGEKWAKHRRIINPAFHLEKLKGMIPAFATSCSELIGRWKNLVSPAGSCELNIWPEIQSLTADVISRTAFGSSYEEGKRIFELQKELAVLVVEAMQTLYIPGFRFIPTKKNRRRKYLNQEINAMLRNLIYQKDQGIRIGQESGDDLLGLLLQSTHQNDLQENMSSQKKNKITIEEVIEECKVFYFAGHETTSSWLTWTMVVLAMHPDWQEKAREEVLQVCGKNKPDFDDLNHLKIVTMVLYEVLRLYPPVIAIYQHTYNEVKIGEITLPAGIDITLPTLLIHHDSELWGDDAEEFKPERFSEGVSKASKHQHSFFPFGWGPRICIGQNFAMIEAKMALAMILQHFSFELSPSYAHAPHTVMTLQPQHGAQIILHQL